MQPLTDARSALECGVIRRFRSGPCYTLVVCANSIWIALISSVAVAALASGSDAAATVTGCVSRAPAESPSAREARHRNIAERRKVPAIICHRGASAFAPENTLEAYSAAMDLGADGSEIDIRRSADGVLYCFHDGSLDRLTDAFGRPGDLTYPQLLALRSRSEDGFSNARIPTLAAVLELARRRDMLLHLDIKEPGIDREIGAMLTEADVWDQIVSINDYNSESLLKDPRYKPLRYKAAGLFEDCLDWDPDAVKAALAAPGEMIIVDDPRLAAHVLGRKPHRISRIAADLYEPWPAGPSPKAPDPADPDSLPALVELLKTDLRTRSDLTGDEAHQRERATRIYNRAWATHHLGQLGRKDNQVICWLEYQVEHRSLHRDWFYNGLDGGQAALALGRLKAVESVPVLIDRFKAPHPDLVKLADPNDKEHPISWLDGLIQRCIIAALGELRCDESKRFLLDYVRLDDTALNRLGYPRLDEATASLLRHDLSRAEIESLMRSPRRQVRGRTVQHCLDHPSPAGDAALRSTHPWALSLPRAPR